MVVSKTYRIFAHIFDNEIEEYEAVRKDYQRDIADKMGRQQWMEYNEILFSAHSCAIEGNSFTVDDTRILREQGMAMVPVGRSLLECTEMADHFRAFDYLVSRLDGPFDESLLKEINRLVTEHTLSYRAQGSAHYLAFIRKTIGIIGGKNLETTKLLRKNLRYWSKKDGITYKKSITIP